MFLFVLFGFEIFKRFWTLHFFFLACIWSIYEFLLLFFFFFLQLLRDGEVLATSHGLISLFLGVNQRLKVPVQIASNIRGLGRIICITHSIYSLSTAISDRILSSMQCFISVLFFLGLPLLLSMGAIFWSILVQGVTTSVSALMLW